ncbi:MAG: glycosyltransferase [Acidobacteria bacterium]|nr:MAG: glycosyltransferase [Acidobacteriota bacterium]
MTRLALVPSEPIRAAMAGIGIRYLELARRLPRPGLEVVLLTAGDPADVPELPPGATVRAFERGRLGELLADCDAVLSQGQLANDVALEVPELPLAIDLYDPWLVENLAYVDSLGLDPYRNDHATWVLQLSRGDFFLCSCDEQRLYYLGWLSALGRVHPHNLARDADLERLIAVVPFGVPERLPPPQPLLPPPQPGEKRLLFGGLYDWYDPWPVLEALAGRRERRWTLLLIRNPNPGTTPQKRLAEVEAWCRRRGLWQTRVQVLDWVPAARRYDLLREVDVLVTTHRPSLETRLSLRTRFLDALAAGCPVIATDGGAMSRLLREHGAGWVVPAGDAAAVAAALDEALGDDAKAAARRAAAHDLLADFAWPRVLEPLLAFARRPWRDAGKEDFVHRPQTTAPADSLAFRLRRLARRLLPAARG